MKVNLYLSNWICFNGCRKYCKKNRESTTLILIFFSCRRGRWWRRRRGGRRWLNKFNFVVTKPRHFVLHIPNTPPHDIIISTIEKKLGNFFSIDYEKKFDKKIPEKRAKCKTNPFYMTWTSVISLKKIQEMVFLSKNNKKEYLSFPLPTRLLPP